MFVVGTTEGMYSTLLLKNKIVGVLDGNRIELMDMVEGRLEGFGDGKEVGEEVAEELIRVYPSRRQGTTARGRAKESPIEMDMFIFSSHA